MNTHLPIAVIGAGPVGLAAAAHLLQRGLTPYVLEAGDEVGASIRSWGHVQLFSPWRYVVDSAASTLLEQQGWQVPSPEAAPTGAELVEHYLAPLAAHPTLAPHIHTGAKVIAVARQGHDKMKDAGRADAPFVLHIVHADGQEEQLLAQAVIDASGTYTKPNPLGANGLPALGERALANAIFYGIPDVLGADRARYAGKRVLVVGSGHSAFNALLNLATLAEQAPETAISWVLRRRDTRQLYGGQENDALPERGALGTRMQRLVASGAITMVTGFGVARITQTEDGIVVSSDSEALPAVDEIIATTGFRPDLSLFSELRLDLHPSVEAPTALAPLIDPNIHSCGSVPPHGVDELSHPEQGFYIVGMKSYGRAPTFLLLTGYEQVRSIADALAGNWEAAREVQLVLPETGVCSTDLNSSSCCSTPAASNQTTIDILPRAFVSLPRSEASAALTLTPVATAATACCSSEIQSSCCAPEEKADCCGSDGSECACGAG